jgi:hypothetical protein
MEETKYEVEIKGSSPLLMNRYVEGTLEEIKVRKGEIKQKKVEDKLYLDAKGIPYVPANYIRGALIEAGKNVKVQGGGKKTFSKIIGSLLTVEPDAIMLKGEWKPYTITAVNPMTRGRMSVTRPKFDSWSIAFTLISSDDIPEDKMATIIEEAGKYVGIGDWRPQKKGMFGKFIVTKFKKVIS